MRSLYIRIWLTVVAALALFALASGWLLERHLSQERARADALLSERLAGWGPLIQGSLPPSTASLAEQTAALEDWSHRMHTPLALLDAQGKRIAASRRYLDIQAEGHGRPLTVPLEDGRKLSIMRPDLRMLPLRRLPPEVGASGPRRDGPGGFPDERPGWPPGGERGSPPEVLADGQPPIHLGPVPAGGDRGPEGDRPQLPPPGFLLGPGGEWPASLGLVVLLAMLFIAVAAGAYPAVRSITGRLERLKQGVEAFGAGALAQRVQEEGKDEVAALAASFNRAAQRIQSLVQSNQSLLANASHELRSPLARLKMALSMMDDAAPAQRVSLRREIEVNIRELDALVEEVLLSSRLEAGVAVDLDDPVDALAVMAEEASRVGAQVEGPPLMLRGSERLLRRAVRNLLENARRYGGQDVQADLVQLASGEVRLRVCDRGPGVPEAERERIFEPFYRMPGHAEREGGVGLGLALVRQIARRHEGRVHCEPRDGGGSCFVITLPAARVLQTSGA